MAAEREIRKIQLWRKRQAEWEKFKMKMARKLRKVCIAISFYFIFNWKSEGIVIQCQFHCEKGCRRLGNESK